MHVAIVAADLEENLGAGMVAAALREHQHCVTVFPYNCPDELEVVAERVLESGCEFVALPRPKDTVRRLAELRQRLADAGVDNVGFIGKCRPDCVTPGLAQQLRQLGVIRMFVGIENASAAGQLHLKLKRWSYRPWLRSGSASNMFPRQG